MAYVLLFYTLLLQLITPSREPSGRWLVELSSSDTGCLDQWWMDHEMERWNFEKKKLPVGNWSVIEIPGRFLGSLKNLSCVVTVREDMHIEWRDTEPNDPAFINQADMELIGMPKAWDITRGGVTADGDTIVVAIIDTGFQPEHQDLKENIWKNKGETPNDDIDNDLNGYIDDYVGLNVSTGDDVHLPASHHGTSVAGIVGARGNNEIGIAGVNWNVKLLLVSGADFESELILAYDYVLELRKKYRLTNGTQGAFVVATNLSGGINNAFAEDHPIWCEMYNKLGEEGILSVTAAPNQGISVDEEGDMPTTCTSPFMITVTNVDLTDNILSNAGYGPVSIDLGAPGHGTLTTTGNNQYKEFPGTSAATPHVTGTIALIYSTPCEDFLKNIRTDPHGIALSVKEIILESGQDNNSLEEITYTGKRLQTDAALMRSLHVCEDTVEAGVRILSVQPNPSGSELLTVYFQVTGDTTDAGFDLYTTAGSHIQSFPISAQEFAQGYISLNDKGPLPAGLYFLTLRSKEEKVTVRIVTGIK